MGKSTISMAIFNSKLLVYRRVNGNRNGGHRHCHWGIPCSAGWSSAIFSATDWEIYWATHTHAHTHTHPNWSDGFYLHTHTQNTHTHTIYIYIYIYMYIHTHTYIYIHIICNFVPVGKFSNIYVYFCIHHIICMKFREIFLHTYISHKGPPVFRRRMDPRSCRRQSDKARAPIWTHRNCVLHGLPWKRTGTFVEALGAFVWSIICIYIYIYIYTYTYIYMHIYIYICIDRCIHMMTWIIADTYLHIAIYI